MVRALVAAGIVAVTAMVAVAAIPSEVYSPPREPVRRDPAPPGVRLHRTAGQGHVDSRRITLTGEVYDSAGRALGGAVIDASHEASGWRALALADQNGKFRIESVPLGEIRCVVRLSGTAFTHVFTTVPSMTTVTLRPPDREVARESLFATARPGVAPPPSSPMNTASVEMLSRAQRSAQAGAVAFSIMPAERPTSMDAYARVDPSGYRRVADAPLSTFSVDVDTASYANARRFLMEGALPPADAVRVEEWVNYFPYTYASPTGQDAFSVSTALTACPWNAKHQLLRVGVRGRALPERDAAPRNLVFLVDVSGSMTSADKLPLVRTSLRLLVDQLTARDRIALVVYAGSTGLVLPSTPGDQKGRIHDALQRLEAGGSTNGAGGIQLAYQTAREGFIKGGVNRVVLATDGDFNVGITSMGDLTRLIEEQRSQGVFLSVLGVGRGNLKDATLESLADRGNGNYAYIDSLQEARRVLVEQVGATLVTIAKDVKLQVEFNPRHVAAYRLTGYENRALQTEDFADDRKDAGEIGAGHTVTALYEIVPPGQERDLPGGATALRYQETAGKPADGRQGELATVSVRHKEPDGDTSVLRTHAVGTTVAAADVDTAFASAVAEAALVLRKDPLATGASLAAAARRAGGSLGTDPGGWRAELVRLMQLAGSLQSLQTLPATSEPQ
ncbi:MAG TPA: von Willebrand factor type A domain-containing protein [Luteitalea sp.]|nr:von Willebrand factor type A domain-containing protein [Luteitalea sp.]